MSVLHLWRYAIKGLDRDELPSVSLVPGGGFPNDRRWAMHFDDDGTADAQDFDPTSSGGWLHKSNVLCAYTAPVLLGGYETSYGDADDVLVVRRRNDGVELIIARLTDDADRARAEEFFSGAHHCGRRVRIVAKDAPSSSSSSSSALRHHFGNTPMGFKHHPNGQVIHIVNAETVSDLSSAMGLSGVGGASSSDDTRTPALDPSRFRPNVVVSGVPAWSEFDWVGKRVYIGSSVILKVIGRAVRCEATNVDPRNGTGVEDHDVPAALARHFPMHGPYLGVYAIVVGGGTIGIGDGVRMTMMIVDREEALEDVAVAASFGIRRGRVVLATAAALVAVAAMVARSRGRSG